jgi:hypothetical protein
MKGVTIVLLVLGLTVVGLAVLAIEDYREAEARLAGYCRETSVGETVQQASRRAIGRDLTIEAHEANRWRGPILSVGSRSPLALSLCTVRHDGSHVTKVSYDPWYH